MSDEVQTILVIDDHPLMRKGIVQLVTMETSLRLIGEAGDGRQGLEPVSYTHLDVYKRQPPRTGVRRWSERPSRPST